MQRLKKNFENLRLTMLGTGTIRAQDFRACAAVMIESPGSTLLFDCGPGSWLRLNELKKDMCQIDHIFFTHFHPDHIIDLITILFSRYHSSFKSPSPVHIWGASGLLQFFNRMTEAYGEWLNDSMFQVIELQDKFYKISDLNLTWLPLYHAKESVGYRIEKNKKIIAISGDSGYCPELITLSRNADIAILECSFPDDRDEKYHLTPSMVGQIAQQASVKKLILTHLYPEVLYTDIENQISQLYSGSFQIAQDGDLILL
jgi:ribonuclease BN (tRNA processing enzyme)